MWNQTCHFIIKVAYAVSVSLNYSQMFPRFSVKVLFLRVLYSVCAQDQFILVSLISDFETSFVKPIVLHFLFYLSFFLSLISNFFLFFHVFLLSISIIYISNYIWFDIYLPLISIYLTFSGSDVYLLTISGFDIYLSNYLWF